AHRRRIVADDKDHVVAQVLKLFQLEDGNHMTQMELRRGRVDTQLDPERPGLLAGPSHLFFELPFREDILRASADDRQLFFDADRGWCTHLPHLLLANKWYSKWCHLNPPRNKKRWNLAKGRESCDFPRYHPH